MSHMPVVNNIITCYFKLTRSIRDSETSIDFVQGPPGSRRERVKRRALYYFQYPHSDLQIKAIV